MKKEWENTVCLDGKWRLYIEDNEVFMATGANPSTENELVDLGYTAIEGSVPGNFELDMQKIGLCPDFTVGTNALELLKLENKHLWYVTDFENNYTDIDKCFFRFDGIDTFSEIFLNGKLIGTTDNMLITHEIDAPNIKIGKNQLVVHIKPSEIEARKYPVEADGTVQGIYNAGSHVTRKAPHMYGWDIMPRAISGGIWRSVYLCCRKEEYIDSFFIYTPALRKENTLAVIFINYNIIITKDNIHRYTIKVDGKCGDSEFHENFPLWFTSGRLFFYLDNPKLWWTKDLGEQNIYDVDIRLLCDDKVIDTEKRRYGIRTVQLKRTSIVDENGNGEFAFYINGVRLFCRGTNWVPLDAFHSKDRERLPKALELLDNIGCNMVRCWGGNVYEEDVFFDFCDEHGIAVWQDFAMACANYPQDERTQSMFRIEAESVIKAYRDHPSIFLWAGDNECDCAHIWSATPLDPNSNKITRQVLPDAISKLDPARIHTYLPSSPYIDEVAFNTRRPYPEDHLWGGRNYYKGSFYKNTLARFASEIGYFGCPKPKSMREFLTPEGLWPWQDSDEWHMHAVNVDISKNSPNAWIPAKICENIENVFGAAPADLNTYTLASQIVQAEAFKFFIEHFRIGKRDGSKSGILWWNLIDGWPQTSNGAVDYYFRKKIAYKVIQTAQLPVCLAFDEPANGTITLYGMNEYLNDVEIKYRVMDMSSDMHPLAIDIATLTSNSATEIVKLHFDGGQHFYVIEWTINGKKYKSHYLSGEPTFNLEKVADYYQKMDLYNRADFR